MQPLKKIKKSPSVHQPREGSAPMRHHLSPSAPSLLLLCAGASLWDRTVLVWGGDRAAHPTIPPPPVKVSILLLLPKFEGS